MINLHYLNGVKHKPSIGGKCLVIKDVAQERKHHIRKINSERSEK